MTASVDNITALVYSIVVPLCEDADAVEVSGALTESGSILVEISVSDEDTGKVIGRQGRIIKSIRTLARACASRYDIQVDVELVD